MKTNKLFRLLSAAFGGIVCSIAAASAMAEATLEYKLALAEDGKTYQVWMKPSATPKPDISLTGQVTIKAPHAAGFKAKNLVSIIDGTNWVEASRVDMPKEDADYDYISFSFVGLQGTSARNYAWEKGKEQLIFSFENEGGCQEGVTLMANDDPFNTEPNSANTNPGNQFTNLGWGTVSENNYAGNYGDAISCKQ
ncbi:cadherin [Candidatus Thiothrix sp. Deng01]|uniref:Cadherin n=1 Tax=Candidatus Thiothrix phosphatis TaxID=3112415 RepID=A0ABU6CWM6_9GAMM|nr:cadherin [Candidatus Thiothrix sp. Deng01]MEB4590942.1 cadherin [Candidatus Thiothrix sp. Deng01]